MCSPVAYLSILIDVGTLVKDIQIFARLLSCSWRVWWGVSGRLVQPWWQPWWVFLEGFISGSRQSLGYGMITWVGRSMMVTGVWQPLLRHGEPWLFACMAIMGWSGGALVVCLVVAAYCGMVTWVIGGSEFM